MMVLLLLNFSGFYVSSCFYVTISIPLSYEMLRKAVLKTFHKTSYKKCKNCFLLLQKERI